MAKTELKEEDLKTVSGGKVILVKEDGVYCTRCKKLVKKAQAKFLYNKYYCANCAKFAK